MEELDQRRGHVGMAEQRLLHVAVAERDAGLAQVARERARTIVTSRQSRPAPRISPLKPSSSRVAAPHPREAFVKAVADRLDVDVARRTAARSRRSRPAGASRGDTSYGRSSVTVTPSDSNIGSTSESEHPPATAVELAAQHAGRRLQRPVEAQVQRVVALERLDPLHVGDRRAGQQVLAVGGRERGAVAAEERSAGLLTVLLMQHRLQVVVPAARRVDDPRLELVDVESGQGPRESAACSGCARAPTRSAAAPSRSSRRPAPPAGSRRSSGGWRC